jgi:hypothetical protein
VRTGFKANHWRDDKGCPTGGSTYGNGFAISWQNGPLGQGAHRNEPNGAFVEDIIDAAADRLRFYQQSEYACDANTEAIRHLDAALEALDARTKERTARGVEGTHQV